MENPLLKLGRPFPFHQISAEHIEPAVQELLGKARSALDHIGALPGALDYESTFGALDEATEPLGIVMGLVEHLEAVSTSPPLREAYNRVLPEVSQFWSSITLHEALYQTLKRFADSPSCQKLSRVQLRHVEKTIADFRRSGAELDPTGKKRLEELDQALSQATTSFSQNVLDTSNAFELLVSAEDLSGLPESALAMARELAKAKGLGNYRITLQGPIVTAVLSHADDAEIRRKVWTAWNRRGLEGRDNLSLVREIVRLRQEKAQLLGFAHFADYVTSDRMAKNGRTALDFVLDLTEKTSAAHEREKRDLLSFRRSLEGEQAPELSPWDVGYYAEKMRKALYDFDEETLRPYFSADRVLEGAFELATLLYGVRIEKETLPVWHENVQSFRLADADGAVRGYFYVDLYPRETKRDGAWMHGIYSALPPEAHVGLFCANSQPPSGDTPALLSFRDVETVFHEFGHLLHHLLSEVPVKSLSGTKVAQDFVELPSQIHENWCSERIALSRFAKHYQTSEVIPAELVEKLLRSRHYRAASQQMRQLGFARVDLALHMEYQPETDGDINQYGNRILARYSSAELPADYALLASFSHLFSHSVGYAAGYYSYKWAEVLDADAFSRFQAEGILNPQTGKAFRDSVLARGDADDPLDLFVEFMGRTPKMEPMLERQGLLERAQSA